MATKFVNPNNPLRRTASQKDAAPAETPVIEKFASRKDEGNFEGNGTFNPKRFAGKSASGAAISSDKERMYNASGEMNAYDKKDAFAQAAHLLNHVQRQNPTSRLSRQASVAEREEKRRHIAAALDEPTGEGFRLVGQELALPIKAMIDYEGFIRKIFRTRTLMPGELFRIPMDVRSTAYYVGQDGASVQSRISGSYITPDEGKITSFPEIDMMELYQLNFDVLERAQDTARQEIQLAEDKRGLLLLDRLASAVNTISSYSTMSLSVLENLRFQVERHRLVADKFLINRAQITDIMVNMSGAVDPVTQREWNLAGYVGKWLGTHFLTSAGTGIQEVVRAGHIYCVTAPDYLGEMGIRVELFSEPYNKLAMGETVKGWGFVEVVGFGAPSGRAVAKAVKS